MENNARDRETMRAVVGGNLNWVARPTSDRKSIRLDRLVEFLARGRAKIGSRRIRNAGKRRNRTRRSGRRRFKRGLKGIPLYCQPISHFRFRN